MSPKRQRLVFVGVSMVARCAAVLFTLSALRSNIVFFFTPTEFIARHDTARVRIGGLVKTESLHQEKGEVNFLLTDNKVDVAVHFQGIPPALFREGQGVVAEGHLVGEIFEANQLLAKHDERYMPKDVADKLKASGKWRGEEIP